MNEIHRKNNIYKNGEYKIHFTDRVEIGKISKEPTMSQIEYRDALYKFCLQKGVISGFPLGKTRLRVRSNIRAFITILEKNGLAEEFFETSKQKVE